MKRIVLIALLLAGSMVLVARAMQATGAPTTAPSPGAGEVSGGEWKSVDGVPTQSNSDMPALLFFGDNSWKDYTIELEAQKTAGDEGFLIAVRAKDPEHLVWFNVGGWGNTRTAFEGISDAGKVDFAENQTYSTYVEVQANKWHKLKITVAGDKIEGFLDDKSACKATTTDVPATGRAALGTWSTQAKFRNIKVTGADGKVLWEGTPSIK